MLLLNLLLQRITTMISTVKRVEAYEVMVHWIL
jgi:hypothetical protein